MLAEIVAIVLYSNSKYQHSSALPFSLSLSLLPQRCHAQRLRSPVRELRGVISENHRPHTEVRRRSAPERAHGTALYVWLGSHTLLGLSLALRRG